MLRYIAHRFVIMIPTLIAISFLIFVIIQLPPGDFFTIMIEDMISTGEENMIQQAQALREQWGLDRSFMARYWMWMFGAEGTEMQGLINGDFGRSFEYEQDVSDLIGDRALLTFLLSFFTIVFTWVVAFPIGVYSATHQYSWGDHGLTFLGFLGLATPNFLLALVLVYFFNVWFGVEIGGLMDEKYIGQPWTLAKFGSVMEHLIIPVVVIGTSGTAGMIRRLRANLLDELQKQYVVTGRAKGLPPGRLLIKYPLRMALNPFISDIGDLLPQVISGAVIVSVVLNLPTTGEMLYEALLSQDMYLAGSFLLFLALLTVFGVLLSDLALAALDPRIRIYGKAVE